MAESKVVAVESFLSLEDLVNALFWKVDEDELFQFIADLDEACASWELTERLYKHFKAQHKLHKEGV